MRGGPGDYVGTRGRSLRMEAFSITFESPVAGLGLRYRAHITRSGDTAWVNDGQLVGARGTGRGIEGFAIELSGPNLAAYDVLYMTHVGYRGDTAWVANGEFSGTQGRSLQTQGMAVRIVPRKADHVTLIAKAASGDGKTLVITAAAADGDTSVRVSAANGSNRQVWDRRPVRGARGYALISKAHPTHCLARGRDQQVELRPVTDIDTDDHCVWRDGPAAGDYRTIRSFSDFDLKLHMVGEPPFLDRDNLLIVHPWANDADNDLWHENKTTCNLVAGTDGVALNVVSAAIHRGCYPEVFTGTIPMLGDKYASVDYDILEPPVFTIERSAAFEQKMREHFSKLLGSSEAQAAALAAATATSTLSALIERMPLKVVYQDGTSRDVVGKLELAATLNTNVDRSLTIKFVFAWLNVPGELELELDLNLGFVVPLLMLLNALVLNHIALPPIELLGVKFSAPASGTLQPHVLAATALAPDLAELPASSRWPAGKVFLGIDERALNAMLTAALDRLPKALDFSTVSNEKICKMHTRTRLGMTLHDARVDVMPPPGSPYRLRLSIGGSATLQVTCGVLSYTIQAAAAGGLTATARLTVNPDNAVIVTIDDIEGGVIWHATSLPIWLAGHIWENILGSLTTTATNKAIMSLKGKSFELYRIPVIGVTIAGRRFDITLRELDADRMDDGDGKPLALVTGTAEVKMH